MKINNHMKKILFCILFFPLFIHCSKGEIEDPTELENPPEIENVSEFPIMAWLGVPESETSPERFKELKDAGININFARYYSVKAVEEALNVAKQTGIKILPYCDELWTETEKTVMRLKEHPALAGYHLRDEPCATDFPVLAEWAKRIRSVDREHGCYINLFPNYATREQLLGKGATLEPGQDPYEEYLRKFLKTVPVSYLSFDHYPILVVEGIRAMRPNWYQNLEVVARVSADAGIPFWAFAMVVAHDPYPVPTVEELRLQMFSNLAYGAQTLQYFTYWHPGEGTAWNFHDSPINLDGTRTVVYDRVQTVNREIHSMAHLFLGAKVLSVYHTGKQIPEGTRRLDKLPKQIKLLNTGDDGGAVVSFLEKGKKRFLAIVNRDFKRPMKLNISTAKEVKRVQKDGKLVSLANNIEEISVEPGDMIIYAWEK